MVAVAVAEKIGWECSEARNGCRYVVFAVDRPLFCGTCGSSNTYAATERAVPGARRARRPVPAWVPPGGPVEAPQSDPATEAATTPGTTPENASEAIPAAAAEDVEPDPRAGGWQWGSEVKARHAEKARSGLEWWARVTGDLPRKFLTVIEGKRGTGKTRILLKVCAGTVRTMRRPAIYGCAENPAGSIKAWCELLGIVDELRPGGIAILPGRELEELLAAARELRPVVVVLDALKRYNFGGQPCKANTPAENAATEALIALAEEIDAAVVCVLHMQANGVNPSVGGTLMQLCEVVVQLEKVVVGEPPSRAVRVGINEKNRWGPDDRSAFLEHRDGGIHVHTHDAKEGA